MTGLSRPPVGPALTMAAARPKREHRLMDRSYEYTVQRFALAAFVLAFALIVALAGGSL